MEPQSSSNNEDEESKRSSVEYKVWLKLRRNTFVIFFLQSLFIGLDSSFTYLTLWLYLKEVTQTETPYFFYNLTFVSLFLPSVLFTGIIATYVDRTRNIRIAFFVINTLVIIGNVLYMFPFSPWLLVFGRFLTGFGNITRSIMTGEVARSFQPHNLSKKLSNLGMGYSLGYIIGPAFNMFFTKVRFYIGLVEISYCNIPGLYKAVLYLLLQVIGIFFLCDLSKLFDLKAETSRDPCTEETILIPNGTKESSNSQIESHSVNRSKWRQIFSNVDIILLLAITFVQNYLNACALMWRSIIVIEKLQWSVEALGWVNIAQGIAFLFPLVILSRIAMGQKTQFYVGVISLFAYMFCQIIDVFQYYINLTVANIIGWGIYALMSVITSISNEIFVVGILAQMVNSTHQTFLDGVRLTFYRIGAGIAMIVSSLEFQKLSVFVPIHCFVVLVFVCLLIIRRRNIQNPSIVVQ